MTAVRGAVASMRIVPELRAAHIERHRAGTPAELLYLDTNYDLDGTELADGIRRVTLLGALRRFLRTSATTLEVPEPLWVRFWPKHVLLAVGFRVAGLIRGRAHRVVTYAMENNDVATLVGGRRGAPRWVVAAVALLIGTVARCTLDRICFASDGARSTYARLPSVRTIEQHTVTELPAPAGQPSSGDGPVCVFVGVLEPRKGIPELLRAWPLVERRIPGARLVIAGPGPLHAAAEAWAAEAPGSRAVLGRLPHHEVGALLRRATVLVAPSVPDGRWREQIGLPVKEALAVGLTVVTTDQTGLAGWLDDHGHHVVGVADARCAETLSTTIVSALTAPLDRDTVRAALPARDGRLTADRWLHRPAARPARSSGPRPVGTAGHREPGDVVVVNTLGGALRHYTRALVSSLECDGTTVAVRHVDEPSVSGGSPLGWLQHYVRTLVALRRTVRRGARVIVTWPVLGHLDRVVLRVVLGRTADHAIVFHDPRPLVHARGYGRFARRLAARWGRTRVLVHSATAATALHEECPEVEPALLPHPLLRRGDVAAPPTDERPVVRVLGQYKPDRDLDVLVGIARELGSTHRLEIVGRRWPAVAGWSVTDEFVAEDRLDELVTSADVVLVPYSRFFQSGIALRSVELGTPAVGPAGSSMADLYDDDRFLADGSVGSWCRAIAAAAATDRAAVRAIAERAERACRDAWATWLRSGPAGVS